jgi:AmiR/NasT family two-component response regulator
MKNSPRTQLRAVRVSPADLELENAQLRTALSSRVAIEQAKGILAERFGLSLDDAFALLRRAARSSRRRIHELATEVMPQHETPHEIVRLVDREPIGGSADNAA